MNVGIDLGTTYSCVATFDNRTKEVKILLNSDGDKTTPSVTAIENGEVTICKEAKLMMGQGNINTVAFYKNVMGENDSTFYIDGRDYTAEDISALYLKALKKDIEEANGVTIEGAVITVPAYFDEKRRNATMNAGKRAGFKVLEIINEPTSAIIAYGLARQEKKTVMVYDLGGGTFDVTIAYINGTKVEVLATNGDHTLGGNNWDNALLEEIMRRFSFDFDIDISTMPEERNELKVACEEAKKRLTTASETTILVRAGGDSQKYQITREDFDRLTESLLNQTSFIIDQCFAELSSKRGSSFSWKDIDDVILVGGSTRMPQVRDFVLNEFGKEPIVKAVNVDTIVASGAAMEAELVEKGQLSLPSKSAGEAKKGLFGGNKNDGLLTIRKTDIIDVTAHSLGMLALDEDENFINSIILEKNSKIGLAKNRDYILDNDMCEVYVLQGEDKDPRECNILYKYRIDGLDNGRENHFSVFFTYDANGMVQVAAETNKGKALPVSKEEVKETIDDLLDRLMKEKDQAKASGRVQVMAFVDVSGSMSGNPIQEAKDALRKFASALTNINAEIEIIAFSDRYNVYCPFTSDKHAINRGINEIEISPKLGYGNCWCNLECQQDDFDSSKRTQKIILLLTDGVWSHQDSAIKHAANLKANDTMIYAVGFGSADNRFLNDVASPGCARMIDLSELVSTFTEIAGSIAKENAGGHKKKFIF